MARPGLGPMEAPVRLQDVLGDLPAHVVDEDELDPGDRLAVARGDSSVEQEDGDPAALGVVQGVDHGGIVEGLHDQARDPAVDGRPDRAGQPGGRGRRARTRAGRDGT